MINFILTDNYLFLAKSKNQISTTEASKNPSRVSIQGLRSTEPKLGSQNIKIGNKPNPDIRSVWETASPPIKRKVKQVPNVVTPQRIKRKRRAQPDEGKISKVKTYPAVLKNFKANFYF